MGLYDRARTKLAPVNLAFAYVGWGDLRPQFGRAPLYILAASFGQFTDFVRGSEANDWRVLAKRPDRGAICDSSIACRIGRLGVGTKGRFKYTFPIFHLMGLFQLRPGFQWIQW